MNRRLGVALALAFGLHAIFFTLLHVRRGPKPKPVVVEPVAPTEFETTNVALGESEPSAAPGSATPQPAPEPHGSVTAGAEAKPATATAPVTTTDSVTATGSATATATATATDSDSATGGRGGNGGRGSEGGNGGSGGSGGSGVAVARVDRSALLGQILARVRNAKRYPEAARRRELEGTVHVRFMIGADGAPRAISTANADPLLEAATKEAIERAAPLPVVDGPIELDVDYALND